MKRSHCYQKTCQISNLLTQVRIKCGRVIRNGHFRLYASTVLMATGLFVYAFVLCPDPVYVDRSSAGSLYISLINDREGRTGNQLFQYAALLGIANKTGRKAIVPSTFPLLEIFSLTHTKDVHSQCWVVILEEMPAGFDKEMNNLPLTNVTVGKFLQSWKYFHHIQDIIRSEFQFRSKIKNQAVSLYEKYISSVANRSQTVVGIHVRRGDTDIPENKKLGYTMADIDYFNRAMGFMRSKLGRVTFLVAGDDLPWVRANLNFTDTVITDDHPAAVHLALLSLCGHLIQSTGTFGWWAAWFVKGHVVYYKDYPVAGSWLESMTRKEEHYLPHWVPL